MKKTMILDQLNFEPPRINVRLKVTNSYEDLIYHISLLHQFPFKTQTGPKKSHNCYHPNRTPSRKYFPLPKEKICIYTYLYTRTYSYHTSPHLRMFSLALLSHLNKRARARAPVFKWDPRGRIADFNVLHVNWDVGYRRADLYSMGMRTRRKRARVWKRRNGAIPYRRDAVRRHSRYSTYIRKHASAAA